MLQGNIALFHVRPAVIKQCISVCKNLSLITERAFLMHSAQQCVRGYLIRSLDSYQSVTVRSKFTVDHTSDSRGVTTQESWIQCFQIHSFKAIVYGIENNSCHTLIYFNLYYNIFAYFMNIVWKSICHYYVMYCSKSVKSEISHISNMKLFLCGQNIKSWPI